MQGTLGVESNAAQPLYLNRPVTVGDVKAYVQAAPNRRGDHVHDLRGRLGLADLDHSCRPDGSGCHPSQIGALTEIPANTAVSIGITAVGTTSPGSNSRSSSTRNGPDLQAATASHDALAGLRRLRSGSGTVGCVRYGLHGVRGVPRFGRFRRAGPVQKDDPFGHRCSRIFQTAISPARTRFRRHLARHSILESLKSAWTMEHPRLLRQRRRPHDVKWIGTPGITITCNTTARAGHRPPSRSIKPARRLATRSRSGIRTSRSSARRSFPAIRPPTRLCGGRDRWRLPTKRCGGRERCL